MQHNIPSLSVILPAHDAAVTLEDAVRSILFQSYHDFELILLNDGSTDQTAEVARRLEAEDSRIRYYEHQNMGLVRTLNRGLDLAVAPLVARMDADDISLSDRFDRQIAFLRSNESIVLVGAGIIVCDNDMRPIQQIRLPREPRQIQDHLMTLGNAFAHPTVMFRKEVVMSSGGYNSYFEHAEDYALWLEMGRNYELANLGECLVKYRKNPGSVSHKHLFQQVVSELCARLIANRGGSLNDFRNSGRAELSTLLSLGGTLKDAEELYLARGGNLTQWNADVQEIESNRRINQKQRACDCRENTTFLLLRDDFQVSALLPAYNHEKFLLEAIESALLCRQVGEVIVVDDGSEDRTREIIQRAVQLDPRVRDISSYPAENRGAHNRLNELVTAARYPIVAVLNTDDLFCVNRFEDIKEFFDQGYEFAFGNLLIIDENNATQWTKRGPYTTNRPFPEDLHIDELIRSNDIFPLLCHQNFAGTTSNFVFSRDLWRRIGGFRDYRYVHDWDFLLRACLIGKVCYVQNFLSSYRIHSHNTIFESQEKVDIESANMLRCLQQDFSGWLPPRAGMLIDEFIRSLGSEQRPTIP